MASKQGELTCAAAVQHVQPFFFNIGHHTVQYFGQGPPPVDEAAPGVVERRADGTRLGSMHNLFHCRQIKRFRAKLDRLNVSGPDT